MLEQTTPYTKRQVEIMNGLLLGSAILSRGSGLEVRNIEDCFAEWIIDELGSIEARRISERVRIPYRDWMEEWKNRWYVSHRKYISTNLKLTPLMAGVWFEDRGELASNGRLRIRTGMMERDRVENGVELLNKAGFGAFESVEDIYIMKRDRNKFLKWIEPPPLSGARTFIK